MIKIIELDEIAEENPGNYIGKKNKDDKPDFGCPEQNRQLAE